MLGDPQDDQPTVHITGTNGKGSVARMVTALLGVHDLSVGTYTSPHLERITERISRNGEPIPDAALAEVLTDLASIESLVEHTPSYFELLTAAAYRWFSSEAVAAAVVEVGLLGRWDATNVVDGVVAVLTNVGHDHTDGLGDWRRRIAEEKAGIVKAGRHLRPRRDGPLPRRRLRIHSRRRDVAPRRRVRPAPPTAWPWGGGCSTSAPLGVTTTTCSLPSTAPIKARTRRSP